VSSRGRHTRFKCDWSSDVCSSDLAVFPSGSIAHPLCDEVAEWLRRWTANPLCSAHVGLNPILVVKGPQGLGVSFSNKHSRGGHFRDYITSVQLLTFPFSMSGCISIWRWTANPLCSARVGSNPILVVKGPSRACVVFLKRAYEAILGTTSPVSSSLPSIPSLSG